MKTILTGCILFVHLVSPVKAEAQTLTLEDCYTKAEQLSPLKQKELFFTSINELKVSQLRSTNYPSIAFEGSASYQSETFVIPLSAPGQEVPVIPKDQYGLKLNVSQKIYDGGLTGAAQRKEDAQLVVSQNELEVSLYQIKNVINDLFFGIRQLEAQERVFLTTSNELDNQLVRMEVSVVNGVALESSVKSIRKERIRVEQQSRALQFRKQALLAVLSDWIGESIPTETKLLPTAPVSESEVINRPELQLFASQSALLKVREDAIKATSRPKVLGFATAGFGSPNPLNIFEIGFEPYYIIGGKIQWDLPLWGETRKQLEVINMNRQIIDVERANFVQQINRKVIQKEAQIDEMRMTIELDSEVTLLQSEIVKESKNQLDLGVLSTTDYLSELNDQTNAEIQLALHEIELEKLQIELKTLVGDM